jgi:two-component system, OmpR family, alkaline phosphatase synthesis response regulator PhoP
MPDLDPSAPERGRILVADDEPHIRRILATFLEASGFVVDEASDGLGAMELLEGSASYDMALLDIMMPDRSGLDVLEAARALPRRAGMPIVILTAKGQDADREAAFALGATEFITKPFSPKKLLARIQELLEHP